jgi:hypothetical protein
VILFVDFDGVLHPRPVPDRPGETDMFVSLHLLENVLRQVQYVEVVISSSWRERFPLHEMREFFSEDLRERVIDATPLPPLAGVPAELMNHPRHAECEAWLHRRGAVGTRWLALDDSATDFAPGCANLLLIDGALGLTAESAAELLKRFQVNGGGR